MVKQHLAGTGEREIFIDNLLVRVHLIIEMSRPALRHGSLNSLFQSALYQPSYQKRDFVPGEERAGGAHAARDRGNLLPPAPLSTR